MSPVNRLVSILLLALLPLQFGWAVASAYCEHEVGAAAQHFGHHEHQHRADTGTDESGKKAVQQQAAAHADCASCHAGFAGVVLDAVHVLAVSLSRAATPPPLEALASAHLSEPERPNWSTSA